MVLHGHQGTSNNIFWSIPGKLYPSPILSPSIRRHTFVDTIWVLTTLSRSGSAQDGTLVRTCTGDWFQSSVTWNPLPWIGHMMHKSMAQLWTGAPHHLSLDRWETGVFSVDSLCLAPIRLVAFVLLLIHASTSMMCLFAWSNVLCPSHQGSLSFPGHGKKVGKTFSLGKLATTKNKNQQNQQKRRLF